jgi:hypothetical protein
MTQVQRKAKSSRSRGRALAREFNKIALRVPGSARGPRAGERVLAVANFSSQPFNLLLREKRKVRFGATPKPARLETCAPQNSPHFDLDREQMIDHAA